MLAVGRFSFGIIGEMKIGHCFGNVHVKFKECLMSCSLTSANSLNSYKIIKAFTFMTI